MVYASRRTSLSRRAGLATGAVLLLFVLLAPPATACGDLDLLCRINELDQQLGVTNQTVSALNAAVGALSTGLAPLQTAIQNITTTFNELSQDVVRVVEMFNAAMSSITSETMSLSNDLVMRVEEARRVVDFFMGNERDRYLAFVGTTGCSSACEAFRSEIVGLLEHIEATANLGYRALVAELIVASDQPLPPIPRLDLSALRELLASVPGVILYGLYRTFPLVSVEGAPPPGIASCTSGDPTCALATLNGFLAKTEEAFQVAIDVADDSAGASATRKGYWPSGVTVEHQACLNLMDATTSAELASSILATTGGTLKGLGFILEGFALSGLTEQYAVIGGSVAIHAGVGIRSNNARVIGRFIKVLGSIAGEVGKSLEEKVGDCRARLNNGVILCWLSVKNPVKGNINQPSTYQWCVDQIRSGASF